MALPQRQDAKRDQKHEVDDPEEPPILGATPASLVVAALVFAREQRDAAASARRQGAR
jgi:hypothetical protein